MRTMYDAVTPSNIPADAQMVAGYVDGRYAWSAADWARFPGAVRVRIAVFPWTNDGHVLDVERGDATPAQAPGWVQRRRAAGVDPTVYCGLASAGYSWADVRAAFQAQGVPEPHYWIAAYPGIGAALYPGSVAHQYANPGPYDLSVVADYWPGVDNDATATANVISSTGGALSGAPGTLTATPPEYDMPLSPDDLTNIRKAILEQPIDVNDVGLGSPLLWQLLRDVAISARNASPESVWSKGINGGASAEAVLAAINVNVGYAVAEATKAAAAQAGGQVDTGPLLDAIHALPAETVAAIKAAL